MMAETVPEAVSSFQDTCIERNTRLNRIDDLLERYLTLFHEYDQLRAQLSKTMASVRCIKPLMNQPDRFRGSFLSPRRTSTIQLVLDMARTITMNEWKQTGECKHSAKPTLTVHRSFCTYSSKHRVIERRQSYICNNRATGRGGPNP